MERLLEMDDLKSGLCSASRRPPASDGQRRVTLSAAGRERETRKQVGTYARASRSAVGLETAPYASHLWYAVGRMISSSAQLRVVS